MVKYDILDKVQYILIHFRKKNTETKEPFNSEIVEELQDIDGTETITIRNPVYDSIYPHQTQI